jgi:uncharacterized protein (DUF736 family)
MSNEKNNTGVLFKNKNKESDNQPDYKGHIVVDNIKYWLSGWIKLSKKDEKYMSLSIQEIRGKVQQKIDRSNQ